MMVLKSLIILACSVAGLAAMESFDSMPTGALTSQVSAYGKFSAEAGHAEFLDGKGRAGTRALHLMGGKSRTVEVLLDNPIPEKRVLDFWAERWTARGGFEMRIEARLGNRWELILREDGVKVGGYQTRIRAEVPAGTSALRIVCSSEAGVLIDDLTLSRPGPMTVEGMAISRPVIPVLRRKAINPVLRFTLATEGQERPAKLEAIELSLAGTTRPQDIARIEILPGTVDPAGKFGEPVSSAPVISSPLVMKADQVLEPGENSFWVSVVLKDDAAMDGLISVSINRVKCGDKVIAAENDQAVVPQRVGIALRQRGDDGSNSYRIPGLVRTKSGALIAAYDIRYKGCGDLPGKIDVGVSRSVDDGQNWEEMQVAMHPETMGAEYATDGCGDPTILVDEKSGRIWMAALWSHGNRGWGGSGPGMTPDETGQLILTHSDDDGKTWSELRNITSQIKKPEWRLAFNGPGAGICMKDGTLVIPAQFRAADGGETQGKPFSSIIWSKDAGETWTMGSGARIDTTEAQVVELDDGSLMLNCRDNRGGSRTVMVTRDLGKTWTPHSTDRGALPEPVCMASLLRWDRPGQKPLFVFSNPATTRGRHDMTLKFSTDDATTWPKQWDLLYDSRNGSGYSCLAPAGENQVGVLYEGNCEVYFLRIPVPVN